LLRRFAQNKKPDAGLASSVIPAQAGASTPMEPRQAGFPLARE
jgi:hypothetical protein